jgi:hypothetical protein
MNNAAPHTPPRYTAELANRALPLVRRIVDDLVMRYRDWQDAVSKFEYATTKSTAAAPDPEADALQAAAERMAAEVDVHVGELTELGVEVRAFDIGLVDFPGDLDGRAVYFCWMRGEPAVGHWHEIDAGFDQRQPCDSGQSGEAKGTSISMPSRAQPVAGNTSRASRSKSDGSRE